MPIETEEASGIDREGDDNSWSNPGREMFLLGKPDAVKVARPVWRGGVRKRTERQRALPLSLQTAKTPGLAQKSHGE